ncbi:LysR family transcriptional regulator [Pseudomonas sp. TH05]|uniref:LysR family transcriptional regulator n=1 Tax=unclassified Pseudomonas TaxID=196821 RepID=UPI000995E667|nr:MULTISPECIES: LysR family transcriptional regulator [unclassified Pseudomonas]MBK5541047.1 LysR family transcriptional regulator [Pseudomonas sp. TH07]MBK5557399.1 LysR family transcriptional regulator [Pseudomonas sp. TH05]OOV92917.1 LysR family transcriptional regulator [Pseudomonas sp. MF4836]
MDNLNGLLAFVRTVESGSLVGAAERLGISASAVGKSLARLEHKLGVRLLNRSTRRISLTDEGTLFFERCQRIVGEVEEAEAELARISDTPRGKLRVSLPAIGYRMLLPILPEFTRRYPQIELDLDFNDRLIDVIAEGVDAVIRSGELADSQLKSRTLGPFGFVLVSAPQYFAEHGTPQSPRDLEQHACLRYKFPGTTQLQQWTLRLPAGEPPLSLRSALTSNNLESLIFAASQGLGIAFVPDFVVRGALAEGSLVAVLDDYQIDSGKFSVLWPSSRHLLPKLRVFVDFLGEHLRLGRD